MKGRKSPEGRKEVNQLNEEKLPTTKERKENYQSKEGSQLREGRKSTKGRKKDYQGN